MERGLHSGAKNLIWINQKESNLGKVQKKKSMLSQMINPKTGGVLETVYLPEFQKLEVLKQKREMFRIIDGQEICSEFQILK